VTPRRKRRAGGALAMFLDVIADARQGRRWFVLVILLLIAISVAAGSTAQYTVPWVVYGGL
jgi:hypothetical protein